MNNTFCCRLLCALTLLAFYFFAPAVSIAQIVPEPTARQIEELNKAREPYRRRLAEVLEADKSGQYQRYQSDLKKIAETSGLDRRRAMLEDLQRDHYSFIKKAYESAVINHEEQYSVVARALGHKNFVLDEFGGIHSLSMLPPLALLREFTAERHCPLTATELVTNQAMLSICTGVAEDCTIYVASDAVIAAGCRASGYLGEKFTLTSGSFQKVTVVTQGDVHYYGLALSLGGYNQATVKLGVRLTGPNFNKTIVVREEWCVAPLIWYSAFDFTANDFVAQAVFGNTFAGGSTLTAQAYNEAFAVGAVGGGGGATVTSQDYNFVKIHAGN
jgi:hypothetical protein